MIKQENKLAADLEGSFDLPVFVDEASEDELPADNNYFLIVYGDLFQTNTEGNLSQEVYVVFISEDNPQIESQSIDIVTLGVRVSGFVFSRSIKERIQKGETDDFFNRVTFIFRRLLKHER
ncbi:hypothetical protein GLV98_12225 [Halobacillus litoralis]|uniref:DUF3168 domain-containing protein n=1 Tax=Halobacillus litoralis TaxID=45668 RepID=A0A845E3M9_9BACI|nr:hypothetical protein [Halobacillus litoralis]MYL50255.1 hypothetical protein [Halobacillus litoralis]